MIMFSPCERDHESDEEETINDNEDNEKVRRNPAIRRRGTGYINTPSINAAEFIVMLLSEVIEVCLIVCERLFTIGTLWHLSLRLAGVQRAS